ncbi:MAG TPA: PEGA domain-containing protein [Polyangiaceae bacterium]|nr:PEGA domain-containing protein [Polyangiaceae bacterium]
MNRGLLAATFALVVPAFPHPARAQPTTAPPAPSDAARPPAPAPSDATRAEARERFDRGLRLFNAGDNAGALVEFRRAYELVQNPIALYNIGLVYGQMGRAVEATDALDQVLASPGSLSPERLALARKTRDEQAARIAQVAVDANVDGARIEIDGIEVGKTPAAAPLRVPGGTHVIGLVAPGYSPQRKEIAIASGEKQALHFELVTMNGGLAQLVVKTHLPGADLYADDQRIETTPIATSVALAPGRHRIELRRTGYVSASTEITLSDGATGEVTLEPEEDRSAIGSQGELVLAVSEAQPVVTVDGHLRGVYVAPLRLAAGPHHLVIERGDFAPFERDVTVDPRRSTTVRIVLEPTADYRTRFAARARTQRTLGWVAVVVGPVLAAAGAALAGYDAKQRSDGNSTIARIDSLAVPHSGDVCDPAGQTGTPSYQTNCVIPFGNATSQVNDANTRDYVAWSAVGVGVAGLTVGVVLLATGEDPHKYDHPASPETEGTTRAWPVVWTERGGGALGVAGSF